MKLVYCDAHSVLTFDEMRLFHSLGHEVFNVGGYIHPSRPQEAVRPPLPAIPEYPALIASVDALGQPHAPIAQHGGGCSEGHADTLDMAKRYLPDEVLEWADVVMFAAKEHTWLIPQWDRIREKRVIWRTIGQSGDQNEAQMAPLAKQGCEIVRYSPKEWNIPYFAGSDALIRFYKDPEDWHGWTGEEALVTNVTQALLRRSCDDFMQLQPVGYQWTNVSYWLEATRGLPVRPMGLESENIGGKGEISQEEMAGYLRTARCYLYTGTQPASYTLGMIEAMMTGCPVVSIGPSRMQILPYGAQLFEAHEIALISEESPALARVELMHLLDDIDYARVVSGATQKRALELFGRDVIAEQWTSYLGAAVPQLVAA